MNWPHVHLVLNHIPVVGMGAAYLLLVAAIARRSRDLQWAALGAFVLVALLTIPVYLSGDAAGDVVTRFPGVSAAAIERHEDTALVAFIGALLLGILAALAGLRSRRSGTVPQAFLVALFVATPIVGGVMAWTANLGARIRHPEITAAPGAPAPGPAAAEKPVHDD